ncbi:MAG TPA: hypothetical protein VFX24_14120, partial [Ktedonobacterales bacterium]|nr:hypothetical protein [Ktedonobacterales bacterium]
TLAAFAIGVAFLGLPAGLTVGPNWLPLVISVAVLGPLLIVGFFERPKYHIARRTRAGMQILLTAALLSSVALLVVHLSDSRFQGPLAAGGLLRAGALLWVSNILIFAVWYWEIDGDGPVHRHQHGHPATDFLFPQQATGQPFAPGFVDYLFLAFGFATALSPADTAPLTPRAKLLMMSEALISITIIALLVARSVNVL